MPGYNVEAPGAAFSNTLEDYLTRQRREAMAQQELQQRMQEMNLRAQAEQQNLLMRQAEFGQRIKENDVQDFTRKTATLQKGDIPGNDYVEQATRLGFGHLVPKPAPLPEAMPGVTALPLGPGGSPETAQPAGVNPPQPVRFTGLPAEREQERQRLAGEALLQGLDPNSREYKGLQYELTTNKNAPAGFFGQAPTTGSDFRLYLSSIAPGGDVTKLSPEQIDQAREKWQTHEQPPTAPTLSEGGMDMAARHYAMTGQLPPMGMGKDAKTVREAIINRAAQYDTNTGQFNATSPPNITQNKAQVTANQAALTQLQRNSDAVSAFSNTARENKKLFDEVLKNIPDTGITWGNAIVRGGATVLGSQSMAQFNALRQSLSNEYARIISNPNLVGVMSDRARQEMNTVLDPNAPVGAIKAALDALVAESDNRDTEFKTQIKEIQGRLGPASTPAKTGGGGGATTLDSPLPNFQFDAQGNVVPR